MRNKALDILRVVLDKEVVAAIDAKKAHKNAKPKSNDANPRMSMKEAEFAFRSTETGKALISGK